MRATPLVSALLWGAAGGLWAADPDGEALVRRVFEGPRSPYRGEITITHWSGPNARAEEARVFVQDRGTYRYEYLTPAGRVGRVVVAANGVEHVLRPEGQRARAKPLPSPLSPEKEWALFLSNYRVSAPTRDRVADRPVWTVELTPLTEGKPRERWWFDDGAGVVLALRRYGPDPGDASVVRFVQFEPVTRFDPRLFEAPAAAPTTDTPAGAAAPRVLPCGFVLKGDRRFQTQGATVTQWTYTDGLTVVSFFRTEKPVRLAPRGRLAVVQEHRGPAYFTVISDGSEALLRRLCAEWPDDLRAP